MTAQISNHGRTRLRVWIDLANSPHPILFEPIVDELEREGHEVVLTARDHAQTVDLARQRWPDVRVIGGKSPPGRVAKTRMIARRARALTRFARAQGVDVAVSHNSYAAALAARAGGIRCVTAMDYEFQPANHIAFRAAHRVLVPADFPARALRAEGGTARKVWRYSGFKEEAYLNRFKPDPSVLVQLGLSEGEPFFVARPSPQGATYHQFGNPLFDRALGRALEREDARVVLLPRRPDDLEPYGDVPESRKIVPSAPVDTRSLLYYAAALLGAGGTMNREAALLGTPVFTLYAGRMAALDRRLIDEGRLHLLGDDLNGFEDKLSDLARGDARPPTRALTSHVLDRFLEAIVTPLGEGA
jgi:predicted glycosyltransferase